MAIFGFGEIKFGFGDQVWQWPYSALVRLSSAVVIFGKFVWRICSATFFGDFVATPNLG